MMDDRPLHRPCRGGIPAVPLPRWFHHRLISNIPAGMKPNQNGTSSPQASPPPTFHSSTMSGGQSSRKRDGRWMTSPL